MCRVSRLPRKDRFFLIVFSSDPKYNPAETRQFLESLAPALDFGGARLSGIQFFGLRVRAALSRCI